MTTTTQLQHQIAEATPYHTSIWGNYKLAHHLMIGAVGRRRTGTGVHILHTSWVVGLVDAAAEPTNRRTQGSEFLRTGLPQLHSAQGSCNGNGQYVGAPMALLAGNRDQVTCRKCLGTSAPKSARKARTPHAADCLNPSGPADRCICSQPEQPKADPRDSARVQNVELARLLAVREEEYRQLEVKRAARERDMLQLQLAGKNARRYSMEGSGQQGGFDTESAAVTCAERMNAMPGFRAVSVGIDTGVFGSPVWAVYIWTPSDMERLHADALAERWVRMNVELVTVL